MCAEKKARAVGPGFSVGEAAKLCRGFFGACGFGLRYGPVGCAYFEAGESADRDVFAELGDLRSDKLRDGLRCFLDERLVEEAELFVELGELAFEHLLDDVGGLAG